MADTCSTLLSEVQTGKDGPLSSAAFGGTFGLDLEGQCIQSGRSDADCFISLKLPLLIDEEAFFKRLVMLSAGTFFIFTTSGSRKSVDYARFISDYSIVVQVRGRYTCAGVLTDGGSENRTKRPLDEIICAHTPVLHYAAARVDLMSRKLIRGGNNGRNVGKATLTTLPS